MKSVKKSTFIATCVVLGLAVLYLSVLQVILHDETSESFYQPTAMSRSMMTHPSAGVVASSQHSRPGSLGSGSVGSAAGLNVPAASRSNRSATYAVRLSAPRTGARGLVSHAGALGQVSLSAGASSSASLYAVSSSATRGGTMARTSAGGMSPASGGVYTTSSGQLHSYGGGDSAGGASRGGGSSTSSAAGASASAGAAGGASVSIGGLGSTSYTPTYTLALSTNTLSSNTSGSSGSDQAAVAAAMAAKNGNYGIYSNGYSSLSAYSGSYLSADDYLASNNGAQTPGKQRVIGVEDGWQNWLKNEWPEGNMNLTEQELEALYYKMVAANEGDYSMPTLDQFKSWFMSKQGSAGFGWALPIGDSLLPMGILVILYTIITLLRTRNTIK
ncbi:MAG: hypothetical protein ACI30J_04465 [Paludibacteraceae bacterium]